MLYLLCTFVYGIGVNMLDLYRGGCSVNLLSVAIINTIINNDINNGINNGNAQQAATPGLFMNLQRLSMYKWVATPALFKQSEVAPRWSV